MNPETIGESDRADLSRMAISALESLAAAAARGLDRHASGFGLSAAKLGLIEVLSSCDDARCCLYALGDRLGVTRPNVTKLVDGLEREGLVERLPHPHDGRMVQAHLTRTGRDVAQRALPGRHERIESMWDALEDDELGELVRLLRTAFAGEVGHPRSGMPDGPPARSYRTPIST